MAVSSPGPSGINNDSCGDGDEDSLSILTPFDPVSQEVGSLTPRTFHGCPGGSTLRKSDLASWPLPPSGLIRRDSHLG